MRFQIQNKALIVFLLLIGCSLIGCTRQKQLNHRSNHEEKGPLALLSDTTASRRMPLEVRNFSSAVSIAAVGDIMLANYTSQYIHTHGLDYPFDSTRSILLAADIAFGNLEAPFTDIGTKFEKTFNFKVPPKIAPSLIHAGFDVVTLANNHILDYGMEGLRSTLQVLDSIGLAYCGAGLSLEQAQRPAIIERNGYRVAFLGYSLTFPEEFWATPTTGGTNYPRNLPANIAHANSLADLIVVTFHWGAEGSNYPKDYQKHFAQLAIDCGADLVIGHHPHVLQGLEIYKNRLIAYSLGNFSFSSYSRRSTESMILKVHLTKKGLLFAKIIPVSVDNYEVEFQPKVLRGRRANLVLDHLKEFSQPLNSINIIDDRGYIWGRELSRGDSLLVQQLITP